jgi:hypothetical protein
LAPRSAFAHSRVSVASGVACERPVPKRIIIVACSIVFERIGTACRVRAASCIELKRINAGGRVEATGRVEVERTGGVRCVEEASGVKNQGVCAASRVGGAGCVSSSALEPTAVLDWPVVRLNRARSPFFLPILVFLGLLFLTLSIGLMGSSLIRI